MNNGFFRSLQNVTSVHIIGHSLGDVDMQYFTRIFEMTGSSTEWFIYYYDERDRSTYHHKLSSIGLNDSRIHINSTNEFYDI